MSEQNLWYLDGDFVIGPVRPDQTPGPRGRRSGHGRAARDVGAQASSTTRWLIECLCPFGEWKSKRPRPRFEARRMCWGWR
jgi:hypothetical protein